MNSNQFSNHLRKLTYLKDYIMRQLLKLKENKNKKYKILYMNLGLKPLKLIIILEQNFIKKEFSIVKIKKECKK